MTKALDIGDLNKLYQDGESADKEVFAEMRSNVLLVSGNHYERHRGRLNERLRSDKSLNDTQKLRLTKNHIHKISRNYKSRILEFAPGVTIVPKNELDLQSEKAAELNQKVWEDAQAKYQLDPQVTSWCKEYIDLGEVATKIFWDPNKGEFQGYEPTLDPETGEPVLDDDGNHEQTPVFSGAFVFETIYGFNLIRPSGAKSIQDSEWLTIRKLVNTKELRDLYPDPDRKKMITESSKEDFVIFDGNRGEYGRAKDQTLIRETYFRPCMRFPLGQYYIHTQEGILESGDLPYGEFPIIWEGFDIYPTAPRGRSIIKVARPFQMEINRASSQIASHQISVGDDKIIYSAGTKLSPGTLLPGVRGITYQGTPPQILAGRDGSQFFPYIEKQIEEMYDAVEMQEENEDAPAASALDPFTLLYSSLKQRKKYAAYGSTFERFLCNVCELYLTLAKQYLEDDALLNAIGKVEQVNIAEFRTSTPVNYDIKIVPQNDTLETQMGKQMSFNHVLQYVGGQLDKNDIGKIMRNMPFGNTEESFSSMTIDYDNAENEMLALERGELPKVGQYENHQYIASALTARMKRADFKFLDPKIQQSYQTVLSQHEQNIADQAQKLLDAKNEFIPTSGAMIAADLYIPDPTDPTKAAKRVRIPYQALDWLVQKLEAQGTGLNQLEKMNPGAIMDIASKVHPQQQPGSPSPTPGQGVPPQQPQQPGPHPLGGGLALTQHPSRPQGVAPSQGPASPQGIGVS